MLNTDKKEARQLAALLVEYGIEQVVVSPGTRNAPLIAALVACPSISVATVVDERSAAFIALGMARTSLRPVAIACTSGTAALNYASALAEAAYTDTPIVVITADRPAASRLKLHSQTIVQPGMYGNLVAASVDLLPGDPDCESKIREALSSLKMPVHINIQLTEPLSGLTEVEDYTSSQVSKRAGCPEIELEEIFKDKRVWLVAGPACFSQTTPDRDTLLQIGEASNVITFNEVTSGLDISGAITDISSVLAQRAAHASLQLPHYVVTFGAPLVNQSLTKFLNNHPTIRHIAVGDNPMIDYDTYGILDRRIQCKATEFLNAFAMQCCSSGLSEFKAHWLGLDTAARNVAVASLASSPWCQWTAMGFMSPRLTGKNVWMSNGMTVRYAQMCRPTPLRGLANRGVSGIDGSTSTAIGSAAVSGNAVLLTGDMSFQYDMGALATAFIPENFKIVVFSNGGGGIFRHIANTRSLPITDTYLTGVVNCPVKALAAAFGFRYHAADSRSALESSWTAFEMPGRAILEIITDSHKDSEIYNNYFNTLKTL